MIKFDVMHEFHTQQTAGEDHIHCLQDWRVEVTTNIYLWQSCVEIEDYFVVYFNHNAMCSKCCITTLP